MTSTSMPIITAESIEVTQPNYAAAFGNLARLVTGAIEAHDDATRQAYLDKCNTLIEQVYNPVFIVSNK